MNLSSSKEYQISFRRFFLKKKFFVIPKTINSKSNFTLNDQKFYKNKFLIYGFVIQKVIFEQFIILKVRPYIEECNLFVYEMVIEKGSIIRIMEISDMAVAKRFRDKGIGILLLEIIDKMARENKCCNIVGELQDNRDSEPLDRRKRFFEKTGFNIFHDKRSELSGWVIRKSV